MVRVVYITRLRLRSRLMIPRFLWENLAILAQLKRAPGYGGGRAILEAGGVFWTMSLWDSTDAMRAFKSAGAHGAAMPKNLDWSVESAGVGFDAETLPTWEEAHARLVADGRATPVRRPTQAHTARAYALPRPLWRFAL